MDPALAALSVLAAPPMWLFAAADGRRVATAVDDQVRASGDRSLRVVDCHVADLRLRGRQWKGRYDLTIEGPGGRRQLPLDGVLAADGPIGTTTSAAVPLDDPSWSVALVDPPLVLLGAGSDRRLPALAVLTDPDPARVWLQRHLGGAYPGIRIERCDPVVARYRPGQRVIVVCHLEYAATPQPTWPAIVVAKAYRRGRGAQEYGALQAAASAGMAERGVLRLARPLAYVPEDDLSVQSHLPQDRSLVEVIETAAIARDPRPVVAALGAVADALVELHRSPLRYGGMHSLDEEVDAVRAAARSLEALVPGATAALEPVLRLVEQRAEGVPADPALPSHGAFRPAQIRLAGESVGLLDLDGFGHCEPAQDVGRCVAKLRLVALRAAASPAPALGTADTLAAAFFDRYALQHRVTVDRVVLWETLDLVKALLQSWSRARPAQAAAVMTLLDRCIQRLR